MQRALRSNEKRQWQGIRQGRAIGTGGLLTAQGVNLKRRDVTRVAEMADATDDNLRYHTFLPPRENRPWERSRRRDWEPAFRSPIGVPRASAHAVRIGAFCIR
jgi:hypothetical protein